jgi:Kef-type K+ transport system membrane component KefB
MNVTIVLVLLVVLSYAVGHLVARYASRFLVFSGAEYLLVGVLIGPQVPPTLLPPESLSRLSPLVSLLLGLVGFIFGMRASRDTRRLDAAVSGVVSALLVLLAVGGATVALAVGVVPGDPSKASFVLERPVAFGRGWVLELYATSDHVWLGLALGAAAAVASTTAVDLAARLTRARGRVLEFCKIGATSSQITAVVVFGLALAVARGVDSAGKLGIGVTEWALASAGAGVVCGLLLSLFIGRESDSMRLFLATLGGVTFASGIGSALGISPLFVNLIAGMVVAGTSPHAERLRKELDRLRHPLFVLVMIFAGAMWVPTTGRAWLFPAVYVFVRLIARQVFTSLSARLFMEKPLRAPRPGSGLLGQGTLAVAIAVNYAQRVPAHAPIVLTTVLCGTLLFDAFSVRGLRRLLIDSGEVDAVSVEEGERFSLPLGPESRNASGSEA